MRDDLDDAARQAESWRDAGTATCGWPSEGAAQVERFARDVMTRFTN